MIFMKQSCRTIPHTVDTLDHHHHTKTDHHITDARNPFTMILFVSLLFLPILIMIGSCMRAREERREDVKYQRPLSV